MEKILTEEEQRLFLDLIDKAKKVVICAHVSPDGDAIGSTLALKHWLTGKGKQVTVVVPNIFPDFLHWMPGAEYIKVYMKHEEAVKPFVAEADLFIIADLNDSSRMQDVEAFVLANPAPKIMIDHHLNPTDFCQLVISRPDMCATAELICHLLYQLGELEQITLDEATCLYAAMMCDTGAFTFNSNRAVVYECSAVLYMRIRKFGGGGDFMRTQRARNVLSILADKCRGMTWDEAQALANNLLENNNKTNLNLDEIMLAAEYAFALKDCTVEELRIPHDNDAVRRIKFAGMMTEEINWPYCRERMDYYLQNSWLVADEDDDD